MKFFPIAIATLAVGAYATKMVYIPEADKSCAANSQSDKDCVAGEVEGAVNLNTYTDDVVTGGKRDLAPRGWTCWWGGDIACQAKCYAIWGRPCGGRCEDGTCYCSAHC